MSMDIACTTKRAVYLTNAELGRVYRIQLNGGDKKQRPELVTTIELRQQARQNLKFWHKKNGATAQVSEFRVSCSERAYAMYYKEQNELVHYNNCSKSWAVIECKIDVLDFSFMGEDALICIIQNIREFRIYNLETKCLVRKFTTPHVARASVLSSDMYWTVGFNMSTHRRNHGQLCLLDGATSVDDTVACNDSLVISKV